MIKALKIPLALIFLVLAVSCSSSDDDIYFYDISPVVLKIDIQDSNGANLLNPEVGGNLFGDTTIVAEYDGKTYRADWEYDLSKRYQSRTMLVIFEGLYCYAPYEEINGEKKQSNNKSIYFGDIDGCESYDKTIVLKYPGQSHEIRVVNDYTVKNHVPKKTTRIYVDGKLNETGEEIVFKK